MRVQGYALALLTREAILDAVRRKIVAVLVIVCFLTMMMLDGCTSCATEIKIEGSLFAMVSVPGMAVLIIFTMLSLWVIALSAVVASDHLSNVLEDGSAALVLSRPVTRETYALSRLLGALVVTLGAGAILVGGALYMLVVRGDFPLGPGLMAILCTVLSVISISAFSMVMSLYIGRIPNILLMFTLVAAISATNMASVTTGSPSGVLGIVNDWGPPFATAIVIALAPWAEFEVIGSNTLESILRLLAWTIGAVGLLLYNFRHREFV